MDMFNNGDPISDEDAADIVADAHITCIECGADGCTGCPSAFCDLRRLVEHCKEHMCHGCVAAFDRLVSNEEAA